MPRSATDLLMNLQICEHDLGDWDNPKRIFQLWDDQELIGEFTHLESAVEAMEKILSNVDNPSIDNNAAITIGSSP